LIPQRKYEGFGLNFELTLLRVETREKQEPSMEVGSSASRVAGSLGIQAFVQVDTSFREETKIEMKAK
jgi:hypothetical protein